ncbi:Chromate resistance protein ChrB [Thermoanaerobacterium saccharolyticum]|uniref:Chromate resistance protein ChrB n=1 Tax=Thermoanaerobacterium saccharolyticum TaxID=28896 RepID=UPI002FDA1F45
MNNKWLAISYKLQSEPSKNRVYVWRKIKEMGAAYLQQGVALLPYTEEFLQELQKLHREITEMGGEASVTNLSFINEEDEKRIIDEFNRLRNEEYEEIAEQCERLIYELDRETQKGKFTFTEIEENEQELDKIHKWMDKVSARDYFEASGRVNTENMIEQATKRLHEYSEEVYQRDALKDHEGKI